MRELTLESATRFRGGEAYYSLQERRVLDRLDFLRYVGLGEMWVGVRESQQ